MQLDPKVKKHKKKGITQPQYTNLNAFKKQQKHYKLYHGHETDYSNLFIPQEQDYMIVDGHKICELPFPKGAYYVPKFNSQSIVMEIGMLGLNVYCKRPYRTNLDSREELYKQQGPKMEQQDNKCKQEQQQKALNQVKEQKKQEMGEKGYIFNDKIRWANVGYQYDWTLRQYPDKKTPIHDSIRNLSDRANALFNKMKGTNHSYEPESAIVNFYGTKDYMTGHLDDAQIDQESPIYSFSFGTSCIFLIGGRTKDEKPTAIRLNSGDLLIMSGQSRKCYHGVPRVLSQTFQKPQLQKVQKQEIEINWANKLPQTIKYFQAHRININIRQVFPQ